jgi:predicted dehydrogenase
MKRLNTVIIGFGNIAQGYADDPKMSKAYPYATHAQVLKDHPAFAWTAVVDPSEANRKIAQEKWGIFTCVAEVSQLPKEQNFDVAVISTPTEARWSVMQSLPAVKGICLEKPIAKNKAEAERIVEFCESRNILLQVNYFRRGDRFYRELTAGKLQELIGTFQCAFGVYGNGLVNNGSHLIDLVRMLLGEVKSVSGSPAITPIQALPIKEDTSLAFSLELDQGMFMCHPVDFKFYRENSVELWGTKGKLGLYQEGLSTLFYKTAPNRGLQNAFEIPLESAQVIHSTVGDALYEIYSNLADAINGGTALWSSGRSALRNSEIVEKIIISANNCGQRITV